MARRCDICGKGNICGHNVSHSHRLTKRVWRPNLQKVTKRVNGKVLRLRVCVKCLRKVKNV